MSNRTETIAALAPPDNSARIAVAITLVMIVAAFGFFSLACTGLEVGVTFLVMPHIAILAAITAAMFGTPYLVAILWLDRNEPEPWYLVLSALAWGGIMATALSGIFNSIFGLFATALFGPALGHQMMASFSAPFIEELTKAAALVCIYFFFRKHLDNVLDGVIYGALIGLGFAVVENWMYYVRTESVGGVLFMTLIRGILTSVGSHASFTALTGLGFGFFRVLRRGGPRWLLPPLGLLAAMFAHFAWNTFAQVFAGITGALLGEAGAVLVGLPIAVAFLQIPFLLLTLSIALVALRHERKLIEHYLSTEKTTIMREGELQLLVPARRRSLHMVGLLLRGRISAWWTQWTRNRLLIRLAFEKWHMDKEAEGEFLDARVHAVRVKQLRDQLKLTVDLEAD